MASVVGVCAALALMAVVLVDGFEVMILPRRVRHHWRLARLFYYWTWRLCRLAALLLPEGRWRHGFLAAYGPLSLFALIFIWVAGLVTAFALLHWSLESALDKGKPAAFLDCLYFSAGTFFTLGYGDFVPGGPRARALSVTEAGLGYVFLAAMISYLPVLYQAFSRREITISLLDARAGSPPTAGELLRRLGAGRAPAGVGPFLVEWERWSAELLESHLSYPVLSYYRSQHENQSWVGALTCALDVSALQIACLDGPDSYQARLTFAMARHAAVDLALVFSTPPVPPPDRLPQADLDALLASLRGAGLTVRDGPAAAAALAELRSLYEPFVNALAIYFHFPLPPLLPPKPPVDNWQTSAWTRRAPGLGGLPAAGVTGDHFD
jgi:hypothetical protein